MVIDATLTTMLLDELTNRKVILDTCHALRFHL